MANENSFERFNGLIKENDDIYRRAAKALGLSDCAFWILYALRESEEALTQSQICGFFFEPKQTVNSALKKMEAEGLIHLSPAGGGRSKNVALTCEGTELAKATVDPIMAFEREALDTLSQTEREAFLSAFRKYTEAMKAKTQTLFIEGRSPNENRDGKP